MSYIEPKSCKYRILKTVYTESAVKKQDHAEKPDSIFHVWGWLGYFEFSHADLIKGCRNLWCGYY